MIPEDLPYHRATIRSILETDGIRSALIYLNGLTNHRFTALYRFVDTTLKKSYFYDRENPESDACEDIPIEASYCVFLKNTGRKFVTGDSLADNRVTEHPKRLTVKSYCGVPLVTLTGEMFGSVCHFDLEAIEIDPAMVMLMEEMASMIMENPRQIVE